MRRSIFSFEDFGTTIDARQSIQDRAALDAEIEHRHASAAAVLQQASDKSEDIDTAERAAGTVALIGDAIENTSETGMSEPVGIALNAALEHLYSTVGYKSKSIALEAHSGPSTRNKVALENIKEFAKKVWNAIIAAFKKIGEYISKFLNFITGANKSVEKKAKVVDQEIKEVKNKHSASDLKEAEEAIKKFNETIFKGEFTASSLALTNNPTPAKPDSHYAAKVEYGSSNNDLLGEKNFLNVNYYLAIRNQKLAHYFREKELSTLGAQKNNHIVDRINQANKIFNGVNESAEFWVEENRHKAKNNRNADSRIMQSEKSYQMDIGEYQRLAKRLSDRVPLPSREITLYFPFDKEIKLDFSGTVPTAVTQPFQDQADTKVKDLIQICDLGLISRCMGLIDHKDEADQTLRRVNGIGELMLDGIAKLISWQSELIDDPEADAKFAKSVSELKSDTSSSVYGKINKEMMFWSNLVMSTAHYKTTMNNHILEWVSLSLREIDRHAETRKRVKSAK